MIAKIKSISQEIFAEVVGHRRHLHANPELSFKEFETSNYICEVLEQQGIAYEKGIVETGVVALIKGKNPNKKCVALRGDMDALPIQENTGLPFASQNRGVMHACGHDMHTSSLLGCAIILNQIKDSFEGTIKLIFQPGEELLPGGAKLMIEENVLENPKVGSIIGQHVYPDLEVGKVGFRSGMYMASADEIYIKVIGKGGHAALPHKVVDPIVTTSHLIIALQQISSRKANPAIPTVLSFGDIQGHGATNVIPNEVNLKGTFRTFNEEWRKEAHDLIREIATTTVEGMGGKVEIDIRVGYPYLTNDEKTTAIAKQAAIEFMGEENVVDLDLRMTAEDFAYFSQVANGCFYRLGTSNTSKNIGGSLHHPELMLDEEALKFAPGLMSYIALKQLEA
ncbi:M20 metallopeptidase family protein [Parvicella tangerina]|uniref:N-acetylcysteine deacetylase n=1 Tax=Parvicella tangerina TaxID=2829795 RepID=A0A916JJM9_9FLAO|nr:M20 family metallopeptidase [Parvicella tangerina]CAG5077015.1 N-acetylcysteine deacetylase [Parvicella tangerina]